MFKVKEKLLQSQLKNKTRKGAAAVAAGVGRVAVAVACLWRLASVWNFEKKTQLVDSIHHVGYI